MTINYLSAAICQMLVSGDKEENLGKAAQMVGEAAGNGAQMVVLPEIFNAPYQMDILPQYAENITGPTVELLASLAQKHRILLVGGSIPEKDGYGNIYNSSLIFGQDGAIIARHHKMHLFDVDIPQQIAIRESATFAPGQEITTFGYYGICFGVIICYDVRFPEMARLNALAGAQILVIPAAFNLITGPAHWELLMRSRAVDNQLYVIAASQARNHQAGYQAWGHSMIVDPWGSVICQADETEQIIYARLDLSKVDTVRRELPLLKHRRTDIYNVVLK
jgi:predicted amidohydrolase